MENKDFEIFKNMKTQDKAKAFDILVSEYMKHREDPQGNFEIDFVNTLDWCAKWFG